MENGGTARACVCTRIRRVVALATGSANLSLPLVCVCVCVCVPLCLCAILLLLLPAGDRFNVAAACLFLASKVEEDWRYKGQMKFLCEVVPCALALREHFVRYGDQQPPSASKSRMYDSVMAHAAHIRQNVTQCEQHKANLLIAERAVMGALGFDFELDPPYIYVRPLIRRVKAELEWSDAAEDECSSWACQLLNDSIQSSLCVQFDERKICAAAIAMAVTSKMKAGGSDRESRNRTVVRLSELFEVDANVIGDITRQLAETYRPSGSAAAATARAKTAKSAHRSNRGGATDVGVIGGKLSKSASESQFERPASDERTTSRSVSGAKRGFPKTPSPNSEVGSRPEELSEQYDDGNNPDRDRKRARSAAPLTTPSVTDTPPPVGDTALAAQTVDQ